ncbi:PTS mannose/fructose/sorbose/N-acetylgalactosamine transporter subunit IIC [Providencia manganoxydans]|uniref:PTS sorbose transporter subunit IIC n=2 Tax=Providencia TaxID=586 RepID=A0A1S1HME5_PROST|nr:MULTISPECIES: PTS sugar transporter subunit IIC [Providencia]ELR5038203.1 PTS sugar transporter subunit IIC [Providencia stuartii]ELR5081116.1 PTS sugar transporter subunit IIC [Providencia stuartii]MDX4946186.1 PTS sugar transporter subunit IIC [Providencia manganoxydans]OHT23445.1 PTS sorbose transporter subunit IIC [Providencia stuartii]QQO61773.1 PTS sugar transporter subunit IIC [Providencia manganoxydans]
MEHIQFWQIILLTLYSGFAIYDGNNTTLGLVKPSMAGFFAGLIMGDVTTGLFIGGTLNLLVLGVGNFGGASIPDYMTGAVLGTTFAIMSGEGAEFGATIAVPIGLLMVQLDILARFTNTFIHHKADSLIERGNIKLASRMNLVGQLPISLSRMIPVFLALVLGSAFVNNVVQHVPESIMNGLKVSGGMLPALGIAILMRYLPIKKNISFLILGFFLAAYLSVPILGAAIIGLAVAIYIFNADNQKAQLAQKTSGDMGDE